MSAINNTKGEIIVLRRISEFLMLAVFVFQGVTAQKVIDVW